MENNITKDFTVNSYDDTNVENLLALIKDQQKEIKMHKKKLEKLEEKFIKTNADFKNILNDKTNIENFLKSLFPKEMHDSIIKSEYGLYDSAELSKLFHVCESKKQNEFGQILSKYKNENLDLVDKNKLLLKDLETKNSELINFKKTHTINMDQLNFFQINYNEVAKKLERVENENSYLMKMLDEKNEEIENLISLEVENAELKAKTLLDNLDGNINLIKTSSNNFITENNMNASGHSFGSGSQNEKIARILALNVGCQTSEQIYSNDHVINLEKQIIELKQKLEKNRKDFNEYREKSHKILIGCEDNYSKLLKENENLKKEISQFLTRTVNECREINEFDNNYEINKMHQNNNSKLSYPLNQNSKLKSINLTENNSLIKNEHTNIKHTINNFNMIYGNNKLHQDEYGNINIEYLKNILLKYLEAMAIGNEFQIKILENVIFTILNIPSIERIKLEEKRVRSSFYYNLWYNAKAFLSAKIYGNITVENIPRMSDNNINEETKNVNTNVVESIEKQELKTKNEI